MEKVIPAAMADSLRRIRPELNGMYEYFRSVNHEPDADDILEIFCNVVIPLYEKGILLEDEMLRSLFGEALELGGRGFIGAHGRFSAVEDQLYRLLQHNPALLSMRRGFMTSLFNALYNIHVKDRAAVERWCSAMLSAPVPEGYDSFTRAGLVQAWICGLARFRERALELAASFSDELLDALLGRDGTKGRDVHALLAGDPWACARHAHKDDSPIFLYAGGHRVMGGNFKTVPRVYCHEGLLFASDAESVYRIYADSFGVELVAEAAAEPVKGPSSVKKELKIRDNKFIYGDRFFNLPEYCGGDPKSLATSGGTVVWTMKNSYRVYIAGLRGCGLD